MTGTSQTTTSASQTTTSATPPSEASATPPSEASTSPTSEASATPTSEASATPTSEVSAAALPIPLFDLRLEEEDLQAVAQTLRSGWLTMGPRTEEFEQAFAKQLGVRHAVAVSSCTAALHLAYLAAGVGPGDEVIVPSYTFAATASAVMYCGATPVFAEVIGPQDLSIDPEHVEELISERTKAVVAVHFAGYPAPVDRLKQLCDKHGLVLIEDAAHAPSATLQGRKLGTWGLAGAFSLFSNKILSVGEGGVLTTDSDEVAKLGRRLRSQAMTSGTWDRHSGRTDSYDVVGLGFNYRIDEPRSALGLSRLGRLEADIENRRALTRAYRERLAGHSGLTVPFTDEGVSDSCCYVMPVLVRDAAVRNQLRVRLREQHGVQTSILYPAIHRFTAYRERFPGVSLARTEAVSDCEITLPLFPHMTMEQLERVVRAIEQEIGG
ncbi:MAG TPA: DegT/DnrJ/EryC1/StrS family aminotransferase [Solirubrobacteraceae bacterium]|nr:DegT/DnrJ/EryC1/StrS family aminotransferase [Solirubrobacteraceae bacterium]